ncbi:MAG: FAD-dependent oxidoreductase [Acidobacteriota bacterium]|nr:FAD-dependent oxidoreductase [Acidobacteriota bacterium]
MTFDVVIVGAGIVGAACADEFAQAGLRVAVIEAGQIGGGATAAGMGHITVMDDSEAQFALTNLSQQLWRALADELPPDTEYIECGTMWVAADDEEMDEVRRKQAFYQQRGLPAEVLDAKALAEAEPNLRAGLAGGLRVPQDGVTYPPCGARFFIERAQSRGAEVFLGKPVVELTGKGARLNDGTFIAAGLTVNATGSWAPELTPGVNVQKRKGHLVITDRYPNFVRHQLIELGYLKSAHSISTDSVAFNAQPRKTGQILIGSSRQYSSNPVATAPGSVPTDKQSSNPVATALGSVPTDKQIDQPILTRMIDRAIEYMPRLAKLSVLRTWTGFRAATPDKLPLIGKSAIENLYLATGHEGLGITTSLGTAKLLADQVLKRTPKIPIEPYLPLRSMQEDGHA